MIDTKGTVDYCWEGKNNTYWCVMSYWIGTGFQRVEREITESFYKSWKASKEIDAELFA